MPAGRFAPGAGTQPMGSAKSLSAPNADAKIPRLARVTPGCGPGFFESAGGTRRGAPRQFLDTRMYSFSGEWHGRSRHRHTPERRRVPREQVRRVRVVQEVRAHLGQDVPEVDR